MKVQVKILNIKTVNELTFYWSNDDFIQLLDRMNLPDANKLNLDELKEMLFMAITDFEPAEAAEIVLTYKLEDRLSAGQIQNIAHDMLDEKQIDFHLVFILRLYLGNASKEPFLVLFAIKVIPEIAKV